MDMPNTVLLSPKSAILQTKKNHFLLSLVFEGLLESKGIEVSSVPVIQI